MNPAGRAANSAMARTAESGEQRAAGAGGEGERERMCVYACVCVRACVRARARACVCVRCVWREVSVRAARRTSGANVRVSEHVRGVKG
jgi:hypothetical protein